MKVSGNTITIINGDSETISVSAIDVTGAPAAFMPGDTVYFTVKKYTSDTTPTIQKIITEFSDFHPLDIRNFLHLFLRVNILGLQRRYRTRIHIPR